jgi:hypothetical protein
MRIKEVVNTNKPLTPQQSQIHALKQNVERSREQLRRERERQRQQREAERQRKAEAR